MDLVRHARQVARLARDLPPRLRTSTSLEQASALVRERLCARDANFLRQIERGVFRVPRSPYLPLFTLAGCAFEDVRRAVRDRGLEGALQELRAAGVYVSYEEFKGRTPIVRGGRVFHVRPEDFDNPHAPRHYAGETSGTTGRGVRMPVNVAHLANLVPYTVLSAHAYGIERAPVAVWRGILPDGSGINNVLRLTMSGQPPERWFSQLDPRALKLSRWKTDLATRTIVAVGRLAGAAVPWPETVPLERADVVARWAAETLRDRGACAIFTQVSRALRVSLAAADAGASLAGCTFLVGGEPPTAEKVRQMTATGARCFPGYAFVESGGRAGMGCARPLGSNDVHVSTDALAVFSHPRRIPFGEQRVPALYFTSLLPTAPKLLLNVENDDYGVLETRACGCLFEQVGLVQHLRDIRSFSKLTGEGVTLVGSEMVAILEGVLPRRFGGSALDYQLLEEEDERGFTRLTLLVSPHLHIADDRQVIDAVWEALRASSVGADQARETWQRAGTLRVKRTAPIWTARGKLMPLHLQRRTNPDSAGVDPPQATEPRRP